MCHRMLAPEEELELCEEIWLGMRTPSRTAEQSEPEIFAPAANGPKEDRIDSYMARKVRSFVKMSIQNESIKRKNFYFISLTHTGRKMDDLPSEIAVLEFNIKNGIKREYSALLDLEEAKNIKRYGFDYWIPNDPNPLIEEDLCTVYENICNFIAPKNMAKDLPPVFALGSNIHELKSTLKLLSKFSTDAACPIIDVYNIKQLLHELEKASRKITGKENVPSSQHELEKTLDNIVFTQDFVCEFHKSPYRRIFCAGAHIKKWSYAFSKHLCGFYNIDLKPGSHKPVKGILKSADTSTDANVAPKTKKSVHVLELQNNNHENSDMGSDSSVEEDGATLTSDEDCTLYSDCSVETNATFDSYNSYIKASDSSVEEGFTHASEAISTFASNGSVENDATHVSRGRPVLTANGSVENDATQVSRESSAVAASNSAVESATHVSRESPAVASTTSTKTSTSRGMFMNYPLQHDAELNTKRTSDVSVHFDDRELTTHQKEPEKLYDNGGQPNIPRVSGKIYRTRVCYNSKLTAHWPKYSRSYDRIGQSDNRNRQSANRNRQSANRNRKSANRNRQSANRNRQLRSPNITTRNENLQHLTQAMRNLSEGRGRNQNIENVIQPKRSKGRGCRGGRGNKCRRNSASDDDLQGFVEAMRNLSEGRGRNYSQDNIIQPMRSISKGRGCRAGRERKRGRGRKGALDENMRSLSKAPRRRRSRGRNVRRNANLEQSIQSMRSFSKRGECGGGRSQRRNENLHDVAQAMRSLSTGGGRSRRLSENLLEFTQAMLNLSMGRGRNSGLMYNQKPPGTRNECTCGLRFY